MAGIDEQSRIRKASKPSGPAVNSGFNFFRLVKILDSEKAGISQE